MLHSAKKLEDMKIAALDGEIGSVDDVYFDDEKWVLRHLVVDTGKWLTGRKVLISPISVSNIDWHDAIVHVNLTREQVRSSPGVDSHKTVSRQHEIDLYNHYGYPYYWSGPYAWGYTVLPTLLEKEPMEDPERQKARVRMEERGVDAHLRSCKELIGYHIHARDDTLGHVEDLLFDEDDWSIRQIAVDTRNWWPGKHVVISPPHVERISWEFSEVFVDITREALENGPEYDATRMPFSTQSQSGQRPASEPPRQH